MSKIGFIGTGIMGRHMARHLQDGGHELLFCPHRNPTPEELIAAGGHDCASRRELAAQAEVIIMIVPDTPQVAEVLHGEDGVLAGLKPGKLVIDMSSISPIETKDFAARINELGCDYLDAPVARVSGLDVPMHYARALEKLIVPDAEAVIRAFKHVSYLD